MAQMGGENGKWGAERGCGEKDAKRGKTAKLLQLLHSPRRRNAIGLATEPLLQIYNIDTEISKCRPSNIWGG